MRNRDVIALEIVIDIHLPVAIDDVVPALDKLHSFELQAAGLLRNFAEIGRERLRVRIEIDEDKLFPGFQTQREHAHRAAIKELDAFNVWRANEAAVERVGPTVIAAAQNI